MMEPGELKPCPFCGGKDVKTHGPYGWYYQWGITHSCKSFYNGAQDMFQGFPNEAEAIAAWNTRPSDALEAALLRISLLEGALQRIAEPQPYSGDDLAFERREIALAVLSSSSLGET